MQDPREAPFRLVDATFRQACSRGARALWRSGPEQVGVWILALIIGTAAGFAALIFRRGIDWLQTTVYGTEDVLQLHSFAATLEWYWILVIPMLGGTAVGIVLYLWTPDGRVRSVADVIEGAALREGRVERKAGVASAVASWITLSTGGSSGREGPVVHLAAMISSWIADLFKADAIRGRDLLGCAVAAAVSASFNAPIAGALFALEVVLRHFALHALAPIVVASAAGTVINRLAFGDVTEFVLPGTTALEFYVELPAFLILGLVCGVVAAVMMRSIFWADDVESQLQKRLGLPDWVRPALAGALLGAIAIFFPHIIGVGYETTSSALTGQLPLREALIFAIVKVVAVAITIGGRMGGGVFSPSLMVGALTGLTFGLIATGLFPDVSGGHTLYALAGMGAVAAAVLGAPISTTLIVFELTGDWQTGLAVMLSVSISTSVSAQLVTRSFFLTQLARKRVHLAAGPQAYLLGMFRVAAVMRKLEAGSAEEERCWELVRKGVYIDGNATLDTALKQFEEAGVSVLPVVPLTDGDDAPPELLGALFHVDSLKVYNRALAAAAAEEHS
ncbi:chloride channel protein, CIC family [Poseidonocella pacifica]|uniref:Chloride channel protein, CIC family n=1 Tax=Poseidonocella pacifica TaxID=871651 RepID=A0A1I0VUK8_9RHOB|nr:chloride channel protein [Poseidonocella pacifica]SFA80099.1 chloride channel protein, CIC family [Poseidonocella pacifica]